MEKTDFKYMMIISFHPIYWSTFPTLVISLYIEKYLIKNHLESLKPLEIYNAYFLSDKV